jgi:sugar phosphate isomerase/epimerase
MHYVYFTKTLQELEVPGLIAFCQEVGLDGVDLAVRPGYPIHPDNVLSELPKTAEAFRAAKLTIGLVSTVVTLNDPNAGAARAIFEACAKAAVPAVKIGYFPYRDKFEATWKAARERLAGFAQLAARTGVRACYHTHSGNYLGNNGAGLRLLLQDLDPHHVGALVDTGHTAVGGGPFRMELDLVRSWLSLVAIKDMAWEHQGSEWKSHVVPAGQGIVHWNEVAQGLKEYRYQGTISLHGEYETRDLAERRRLAKRELEFLKKHLA